MTRFHGHVSVHDAVVAPTVNEDFADGHSVGSRWIDTAADKEYVCLDATLGAAVWKETTAAGGGGGALTQAYVGYNTVGGTWETLTDLRVLAKKVTLANAALLTSIEAHLRNDSAGADDIVHSVAVAVYSDVAGTPGLLLHYVVNPANSSLLDAASGATGDGVARWLGVPVGAWLTAADYWIAFMMPKQTPTMQIAYDATGSDRYYTSGGPWFTDWGFYAPTTSANAYSIRANTIR